MKGSTFVATYRRYITDPTPSPTFTGVLHLEIRRKGPRPGVANIERRVYSTKLDRTPEAPNDYRCALEHRRTVNVYTTLNFHHLDLVGHDPATDTATYRNSVKASETWYEKLELFGWKRRLDLEPWGT